MIATSDQIVELKALHPSLECFEEAGLIYFLLRDVRLPSGTQPQRCDLVLCPHPRDGYPSRLFFATRVERSATAANTAPLNWNTEVRLAERNWVAFSWKLDDGPHSLAQLLALYLKALR
jgi:hypothetical protein